MLEEQSHVLSALLADTETPTLSPLPLTVSRSPCKPLQHPSGFNQRRLLVDEMGAHKGIDDPLIGSISSRFGSYLHYRCAVLASYQQYHTPTESATELDICADSPVVGQNTIIIETTSKTVLVSGFTTDLGKPLGVPVVNAVMA